MYAAPFDNDVDGVSETPINKKRSEHQRTQKRYPKYQESNSSYDSYTNSERVNSILKTIHNLPDEDNLSNFEPIPPPKSAGVDKTIESNSQKANEHPGGNSCPPSNLSGMPYSSSPSKEGFQDNGIPSCTSMKSDEYEGYNPQNRFMPNYDTMYVNQNQNLPFATNKPGLESPKPLDKQDILMQKLNYMITLLEQQQDERTNHVTEEVVLYSFLGIFIIFIVDSFARVGKYVR